MRALIALVAAAVVCHQAHAQPLCPHVKRDHQSEGSMPIPESGFTKQAAERELKRLQNLLGPDGLVVDPPAWETSFVFLEGWFLKRQALEAQKQNPSAFEVKSFCEFLQERGHVRH